VVQSGQDIAAPPVDVDEVITGAEQLARHRAGQSRAGVPIGVRLHIAHHQVCDRREIGGVLRPRPCGGPHDFVQQPPRCEQGKHRTDVPGIETIGQVDFGGDHPRRELRVGRGAFGAGRGFRVVSVATAPTAAIASSGLSGAKHSLDVGSRGRMASFPHTVLVPIMARTVTTTATKLQRMESVVSDPSDIISAATTCKCGSSMSWRGVLAALSTALPEGVGRPRLHHDTHLPVVRGLHTCVSRATCLEPIEQRRTTSAHGRAQKV